MLSALRAEKVDHIISLGDTSDMHGKWQDLGGVAALLKQSGANTTVVTSETAGRLLGIATQTPSVVEMMEDLLTPDAGFAIGERPVEPKEVGGSPRHLTDIVLGVVRDGELPRVDDERVDALELTDRLLYIRSKEDR